MGPERKLVSPYLLVALLLGAGLCRLLYLDTIPGMNGDEALMPNMLHEWWSGGALDTRAPSGKLISPIYLLFITPFEKLLPATMWTLRTPPALVGFALMFLSFFLVKKALGTFAAWITLFVVSTAPIHLIYSRMAIEQSVLGLPVLLAIYFSYQRKWKLSIALSIVLLLVHPILIFLFPMLLAPLAAQYFEQEKDPKKRVLFVLGGLSGVFAICALAMLFVDKSFFTPQGLLFHLVSFKSMGIYWLRFLEILSGVTAIQDLAGPMPVYARVVLDTVTAGVLLVALGWGLPKLLKKKNQDLFVFCGWFIAVFGMYLVAGTESLRPGNQRYGLHLIIPTAWVLATLLKEICQTHTMQKRCAWLVAGLGAIWMAGFANYFLADFVLNGGRAHRVYKTAAVEPKQKAFEWIEAQIGDSPNVIVGEDFFATQAIQYFARKPSNITVYDLKKHLKTPDNLNTQLYQGAYLVGWPGGLFDNYLLNNVSAPVNKVFASKTGEPAVVVWWLGTAPTRR